MRKFLEILFIVLILVFSVFIYLFRNKLGQVSNLNYLTLFFLCFVANSTVFLPAPTLMLAASYALLLNPLYVSFIAALGATLGEYIGYVFGVVSKNVTPKLFNLLEKIKNKIHNQAFLVFILALLPLPLFDFVGIYSGSTKMNILKFFIACYLGKLLKLLVYTQMYGVVERMFY